MGSRMQAVNTREKRRMKRDEGEKYRRLVVIANSSKGD
jgi:hypothetical protein